VVEDEPKLASLLKDYLQQAGYGCHIINHGDEVMPWFHQNSCDAILLDVMLPGVDGMTLCKQLRAKSEVPILMLTARVEEVDRLLGLELGADDYICKPFSPREVVARVKTVLRRWRPDSETPNTSSVLSLDPDRYQVTLQGEKLTLTAVEFHLLWKLYREPGRVFSRQQLMDGMYQDNRIVSNRTIDSHIKKVRKKLAQTAPDLELIESVYGVGYKLSLPEDL